MLLFGVLFALVRWQKALEPTEPPYADSSIARPRESLVHRDSEVVKNEDVRISPQDIDKPFGITLPDGERILVTLRQSPNRDPEHVEFLANDYGRLAEDAFNGDAATAYYLYRALLGCSKPQFVNESDLEAGINELYQTNSYTTSDGENTVLRRGNEIDREVFEDTWRMSFAFCVGIDQRYLSDMDQWRELAIENGHVDSILEYAHRLPRSSPERVLLYERAFELGSINATGHVSRAYQTGWTGQEPDLARAYAYAYIHAELVQAYAPNHWQQIADDRVREIENTMPTYEKDEAIALIKEILANNPGCCIERPFQ